MAKKNKIVAVTAFFTLSSGMIDNKRFLYIFQGILIELLLFFCIHACIVRYLPAFKPNHTTYEFSHTFQLLPSIMIAFMHGCVMHSKEHIYYMQNDRHLQKYIWYIFDLVVDKITNGLHFVSLFRFFLFIFSYSLDTAVHQIEARKKNKQKHFPTSIYLTLKIDCRFCLIEQQHEKCKCLCVCVCLCTFAPINASLLLHTSFARFVISFCFHQRLPTIDMQM